MQIEQVWSFRLADPRMWMAHLGMLNQGSAKHVAEIRRIVVHEYYNARNFDYDIALLQLKKAWPSSLEQYIQPICLPAPSQTFTEGYRCWVTGWGYRSEQGKELKKQWQIMYTTVQKLIEIIIFFKLMFLMLTNAAFMWLKIH